MATHHHGLMGIKRGDVVTVELANGEQAQLRALGDVTPGRDFLVVWVCDEAEWRELGEHSEGVPWPAKNVLEAQDANV